ncbi:hypothetical protein HY967_03635 [Candidatus Jorgensenbacteria bacterium]|nr:hypothetical protein [Candidatus Jorgensenbacteria bacterium]
MIKHIFSKETQGFCGVRVIGTGICRPGFDIPGRIVSVEEVVQELKNRGVTDADAAWIKKRTKSETRLYLDPGFATSDLFSVSIEDAIRNSKIDRNELDVGYLATVTPDWHASPPMLPTVSYKLGISTKFHGLIKPMFGGDIALACSSFGAALHSTVNALMVGCGGKAFVAGADTMERITDPYDKKTWPIFGSLGAAWILEACPWEESNFFPKGFYAGNMGEKFARIIYKAGGSKEPLTEASLRARQHFIYMEGQEVFNEVIELVISNDVKNNNTIVDQALIRAGLVLSDIDFVGLHQANGRMNSQIEERLRYRGFAGSIYNNFSKYANTTSAAIPSVVHEANVLNILKPGMTFMFLVFGGGYTWYVVIGRWSKLNQNQVYVPVVGV